MAQGIRLTGIGRDGSILLHMEPDSWDVAFLQQSRSDWVISNDTGSYVDQDADLSPEELRILYEHFKPLMLKSVELYDDCVSGSLARMDPAGPSAAASYAEVRDRLKTELASIESALGKDADRFSHFHICIFDWESGM